MEYWCRIRSFFKLTCTYFSKNYQNEEFDILHIHAVVKAMYIWMIENKESNYLIYLGASNLCRLAMARNLSKIEWNVMNKKKIYWIYFIRWFEVPWKFTKNMQRLSIFTWKNMCHDILSFYCKKHKKELWIIARKKKTDTKPIL